MENHPIPQDVTGFQFKLIGDMTVKQFAYLAGGLILAWLSFAVLPLPFLIKLPFAVFFGGLGVSLAFLPIEGRPMDLMITHFMKALFVPSQFVYQKEGGHLLFATASTKHIALKTQTQNQQSNKLATYLQQMSKSSHSNLDQRESTFFTNLSNIYNNKPVAMLPQMQSFHIANQSPIVKYTSPQGVSLQQASQAPIQQSEQEEQQLDEKEKTLEQELAKAKQTETIVTTQLDKDTSHQKVLEYTKQLEEVLEQKKQLEKHIDAIRRQILVHSAIAPNAIQKPAATQGPAESANMLMGRITDPRGNPVANILVEVTDKDNNPARALKTNVEGKFAVSTPLQNGVYTVTFEDPKSEHKFDTLTLEANGTVLTPLEIKSVDAREELRRSLFTQAK